MQNCKFWIGLNFWAQVYSLHEKSNNWEVPKISLLSNKSNTIRTGRENAYLLLSHYLGLRNHPASHQHHGEHLWAFWANLWSDDYENSAFLHQESQLGLWKLCLLVFKISVWTPKASLTSGRVKEPSSSRTFPARWNKAPSAIVFVSLFVSFRNIIKIRWVCEIVREMRESLLCSSAYNCNITIYMLYTLK